MPPERVAIRRCIVCDHCTHRHGHELQGIVVDGVCRGEMDPGTALALMLLDDAHHAGMLIVVPDPESPGKANLWIERPVPRWRVYAGRQTLAGQPVEVQAIVDLAIAPYWGHRPTDAVLGRITADITGALTFLGLVVDGISITPTMDSIGPGHLAVHITAHDAPTPEAMIATAPDVEIPDDIMQRARGQA